MNHLDKLILRADAAEEQAMAYVRDNYDAIDRISKGELYEEDRPMIAGLADFVIASYLHHLTRIDLGDKNV